MAVVRIIGTIALKGLIGEHEPAFKAKTGADIEAVWGPTGPLLERCRAGEAFDMLIGIPDAIDTLTKEGHAVAGTRVDVCKSIVGVAVKAGAPHPKLDTVEDVKAALRAAKRVTYTDPATQAPSGLHVAKLLAQWGMTEEINAKTKFGVGIPVAQYLVSDEADLALQQFCEHKLVKGVDVVGGIPMEVQAISTFSVALGAKAANPAATKELIAWLGNPATRARFKTHGLFALDEV